MDRTESHGPRQFICIRFGGRTLFQKGSGYLQRVVVKVPLETVGDYRSILRRGEQLTHQARFPWPLLHFAESHEKKKPLKNTKLQHILILMTRGGALLLIRKQFEIAGMLMLTYLPFLYCWWKALHFFNSFTCTHTLTQQLSYSNRILMYFFMFQYKAL